MALTSENTAEAAEWCGGWYVPQVGVGMYTDTGGRAFAQYGDWILRGPNGFFYPAPAAAVESLYDGLLS